MSSRQSAVRALLNQQRPLVMGVLNVTPDSFSDGGQHNTVSAALSAARRMVEEGADLLDVGGESTRPGAAAVSVDEELERTIPVIEALTREFEVSISIDTSKPEVMSEAVSAGAAMINDVRALSSPGAIEVAEQAHVAVCLMHMQGTPASMQDKPEYQDVVVDVCDFLTERIAACRAVGIPAENIVVDPGFGFGKRLDDNLALVRAIPVIAGLGYPVLAGASRKSMIGAITGRTVEHRVTGSVILAAACVAGGAKIVRVHDVAATLDGLRVQAALQGESWWEADSNGQT